MPRTPLHDAAEAGDVAAIQRSRLAESPGDAMEGDFFGDLPLHRACRGGHTPAVELLLAAAPGTASVASQAGKLPLHFAARSGDTVTIELLLATVPGTASVATENDMMPLHFAAQSGSLAPVQLLLAAAPGAATVESAPAVLIRDDLLETLNEDGLVAVDVVLALIAHVAACRTLSPADWAAIPAPCPGLARALPAVLARSTAEAAELVAHLPADHRSRLHTLALSLARMQRRLGLELPAHIVRRILLVAPIAEETRKREEVMEASFELLVRFGDIGEYVAEVQALQERLRQLQA
eukprot:scaffold10.g2399.t1